VRRGCLAVAGWGGGELMAHLVEVAKGHSLRDDAAAAYLAMRRDGCPAGITSSTRSYSSQSELYRNQGKPGWPSLADNPDRSKHVWRPDSKTDTGARALDLPEPARAWVRRHGHDYGWAKDRVKGELWHMEYIGGGRLVNNVLPGTGAALPSVDTRPIAPIEEDIMAALSHDEQRALLTLLREVRTQTGNIQSVAAKLDDRMHRTNVSMDLLAQVHGGVGTIEGLVRQIAAAQGVDIDEAALARELAPLLTASVGALSDADVARLADAVADEQARRMAG